jgi:hypothetical protein
MEMVLVIGIILTISSVIAWRMLKGLDYMQKNYPDYKGEDLFDEDDKDNVL